MVALGIIGVVLLFVGSYYLCLYFDIRNYNNGKCRRCGKYLKFLIEDSMGRRGYTCKNCGYLTWINFDEVDKKGEWQ